MLVKAALGDLADAVEGIELTTEAIKELVGPVPAGASIHELRRAAHSLDAGVLQIVFHAIQMASASAALKTVASVTEAGAHD